MQQALVNLMNSIPGNADAAIITSQENRRYFTNIHSSAGTLLVTKKTAYFIIDFRYFDMAKSIILDFDVILQGDNLFLQIDDIFRKNEISTVLIEADNVTVSRYKSLCKGLKNFDILNDNSLSEIIARLRSIKSADELENIKQAQAITDKTFTHMLDFIKVGQTEQEVALELEYTLRRNGASGIAFDSIVVSGINSSLPHGVPTQKKLENGDFLTMDFGAMYNGYCSDMTRTVAIGNITDEQKSAYNTVLRAQILSIEAISLDKKYCDIDKAARDFIYANGYMGCFGHGLGHSLGLNVHEEPCFNSRCDQKITVGTIMTVEPGIYLSNKFGIRIEDMIYITENGALNLTKSEKNLITL